MSRTIKGASMDDWPESAVDKAVDKAVARAVGKIERAIVELLEKVSDYGHGHVVVTDYAIKALANALLKRNPAALDWLNKEHRGEVSMCLANALMDWRDLALKR
jgi:hypothetical protein